MHSLPERSSLSLHVSHGCSFSINHRSSRLILFHASVLHLSIFLILISSFDNIRKMLIPKVLWAPSVFMVTMQSKEHQSSVSHLIKKLDLSLPFEIYIVTWPVGRLDGWVSVLWAMHIDQRPIIWVDAREQATFTIFTCMAGRGCTSDVL